MALCEREFNFTRARGREKNLKHYIPQTPHFAYRGTLWESITYPEAGDMSQDDKNKVKNLMRKFGITEDTINKAESKQHWENILSRGEQQRIALISAIYKKPDILFVDEATNALDYSTKKVVEETLKEELKDTIIVAIDHNPEKKAKNLRAFFNQVEKEVFQSQQKVRRSSRAPTPTQRLTF